MKTTEVNVYEFLREYQGHPNGKNIHGWTPLLNAARWGYPETCKHLIKRGADVHVKTPVHGFTPLKLAKMYGHRKVVRILKKGGAKE